MFVTDVLLLSRAWGMSCYAAEHYTQQPTQLSAHSTSFFLSPDLPSITFVPFYVCPLFACHPCLCSLHPAFLKRPLPSALLVSVQMSHPLATMTNGLSLCLSHHFSVLLLTAKAINEAKKWAMNFIVWVHNPSVAVIGNHLNVLLKDKYTKHLHVLTSAVW